MTADPKSLRTSSRHDVSMRVRSPKLPGYRGLTVDLSETGMQLETEGELAAGTVMNLTLEFDHQELPDMTCPARVVWCKGVARNRYRAGLQFLADGPELKRGLRQMATVFKVRSEADIETLLEDSMRLDEERSQQVMQLGPRRRLGTPATSGVLIPLGVTILSYSWQADGARLWLLFREGSTDHQLLFPACRLLRDHGCSLGKPAAMLRSCLQSELVAQTVRAAGPGPWKHYQFLADERTVLLELVSHPCLPVATS